MFILVARYYISLYFYSYSFTVIIPVPLLFNSLYSDNRNDFFMLSPIINLANMHFFNAIVLCYFWEDET